MSLPAGPGSTELFLLPVIFIDIIVTIIIIILGR
jgi:hypothetical protein